MTSAITRATARSCNEIEPSGKPKKPMIKPEKASGAFRFALSADIGSWRVQRYEQREHLATQTLVEGQIAPDSNDLVIGMGSYN